MDLFRIVIDGQHAMGGTRDFDGRFTILGWSVGFPITTGKLKLGIVEQRQPKLPY
jgi:hypothetical protein